MVRKKDLHLKLRQRRLELGIKSSDISKEILLASNLHQESKNLLSEEKKRLQGLDNEINVIIEDGKIKAQNLYNESKEKINKEIKKINLCIKLMYIKIHF